MKALSATLFVSWALLVGLTIYAVRTLGSAAGMIFFSDFQHPWRAQFAPENAEISLNWLELALYGKRQAYTDLKSETLRLMHARGLDVGVQEP